MTEECKERARNLFKKKQAIENYKETKKDKDHKENKRS